MQPTLPVGISFFTFMAISYVIDIYRGGSRSPARSTWPSTCRFFPHLVAGPIVRGERAPPPDPAHRATPPTVDFARAAWLIMVGLFKKVVVSSYVSTRDRPAGLRGAAARTRAPEVLFAAWGYAVQIYCDFSGYTDIAIGLALLLGFRFPVNFDAPYTARNLQDFWRRWHITLSRWLRDYLYIPLGGNRGLARSA